MAAHKHIDDGIKHVENIDLSMETHQSTHISMEMRLSGCGYTSKHVNINIKVWENANSSIQACEGIYRHRSIEHAYKHVDLSKG